MNRHKVQWPSHQLIACTFRVAYEAFEGNGKFKRNSKIAVNQASLSHAEYGGRVGIWRLMDIFERNGVKSSINLNGLAVKKWPESVLALHAAGHELAAHQTTNNIALTDLTEPEEREEIRACTRMIEDLVGERPVGWGSAGNMHTEHTVRLLAQEGYTYFGDPYDEDVPYVVSVDGKRIVIIPKLNYANDWRAWSGGLGTPSNFFMGFKESFDFIYQEALAGRPGYIDVVTHAELGGRPNIAAAVEAMIRYVKQYGDQVWIATRKEIADYMLSADGPCDPYVPYR